MELSGVSLYPGMTACKLVPDPGLGAAGCLSTGSGPGSKPPLWEGVWLPPETQCFLHPCYFLPSPTPSVCLCSRPVPCV